jgi:hypothetical protein
MRFRIAVVDDYQAYLPIASLHPKGISERDLTDEEGAHFVAVMPTPLGLVCGRHGTPVDEH